MAELSELIEDMKKATAKDTTWLHFGISDIFVEHVAPKEYELVNDGICKKGIILCDLDNTLLRDKELQDKISKLENVTEIIQGFSSEDKRLREIFEQKWLQLVSFSLPISCYNCFKDYSEELSDEILYDLENNGLETKSIYGKLTKFLLYRYNEGGQPVSIFNIDMNPNGSDVFRKIVYRYAEQWVELGLVERDFLSYIERGDSMIAFPRTEVSLKEGFFKITIDDIFPNKRENFHKIFHFQTLK